jgi:hypothetical protein
MRIIRFWLSGRGLLVLLVLLLVINGLYSVVAARETILTGQPGDLLYAAGFDGFLDEWQQSAGNENQVVDGVMRVGVQELSKTIYSAAKPTYGDFDVSVTFRTIAGSEENDGSGLIFRLQEQGCDMPLPLLCDLSQSNLFGVPLRLMFRPGESVKGYYFFLISTDGYYALGKYNQGEGGKLMTVWHNSNGLINTGLNADNRVRVVGRGDQFQFFINGSAVELCIPNPGEQPTGNSTDCLGQRVSVWQDASYATGKLGVGVRADRNVGTVTEFDGFTVTMPRTGTETPGAEI